MKKIVLPFLISLISLAGFGQEIIGQWNGILKVQTVQLRLVFTINKTDSGLSSTMDSPDQGAKGIPVTATSFENSILKITIDNAKIEYEGVLGKDNIIVGNFKQRGQSFPMNLSKEKIEKPNLVKPQEPTKPYPYYSEEVIFENKKAGINLAGNLTLPKKDGVFPAVILISGSGPQNRNEELLGHKPFLVLSDYLTKNGIAVLRYDDRGTALSTGNFKTATSLDFATDVEAGIDYLKSRKEIDPKKIGLMGHSEGGLIAPIVASKSTDVAFIVLLAGPGIPGDQLLLLQQKLIGKAAGVSDEELQKSAVINRKIFDLVIKSTSVEQLTIDLTTHMRQLLKEGLSGEQLKEMSDADFAPQINQVANPWMRYFINYNPESTLEKVTCPVLAINGENDLQVPPKENLEAIKKALTKGGNRNVTIKELPGLNHLFQECVTGSPTEYSTIEQTFSPAALIEILNWIKQQTK
ncbi:MAG: alpha/beta fold hydrolase [Chitinophagaceae bacterium]|nr:MAG: alpha/beta fold hydrolase [Chitinophagaceae bacterium]